MGPDGNGPIRSRAVDAPRRAIRTPWLIGGVLVLNVAVGVLGIEGPIGPLLIGLQAGVLIPIWLAWLALRAPRASDPSGD